MPEFMRTLLVAAAIALVIRCFAFEPFSIPSASMVPTLEVGDFLFVSKYSYGYSAKASFFGLPLYDGRALTNVLGHQPQRGEVAVFKLPTDPSTDYIKRIIGLPGDTVQVKDGRLYINGVIVQREKLRDADVTLPSPNGFPARHVMATDYTETLPPDTSKPGGATRQHIIRELSDAGPLDNTVEYTVPAHHYFMMGDNRDNSQDSRVQNLVGYVPEENFVGPARFLFFSLAEGTRFLEFWRWPVAIRFARLFTTIQ